MCTVLVRKINYYGCLVLTHKKGKKCDKSRLFVLIPKLDPSWLFFLYSDIRSKIHGHFSLVKVRKFQNLNYYFSGAVCACFRLSECLSVCPVQNGSNSQSRWTDISNSRIQAGRAWFLVTNKLLLLFQPTKQSRMVWPSKTPKNMAEIIPALPLKVKNVKTKNRQYNVK